MPEYSIFEIDFKYFLDDDDDNRDKKKDIKGKLDLGQIPGLPGVWAIKENRIDAVTWRTAGHEIRQRNFSCNGDEEGW